QPPPHLDHLGDGGGALPGVAEAHRHVRAHPHPVVEGPPDHRLEHLELALQGAVQVLGGERLGGAGEHRDLRDAPLQRPVQAALVRHQHRVADAGPAFQPVQQLLGVGELGHPLGVDEAGRLDHPVPGVREPVDELRLHLDGHDRRLVLQAVAGADLVDGDLLGQTRHRVRARHHASSTTASTASMSTDRPAWTGSSATRPSRGAVTVCSIFMASTISSGWPSLTWSPTWALTTRTVPGMGLLTTPSPPPAAPWRSPGSPMRCRVTGQACPSRPSQTVSPSRAHTYRAVRPSRVTTISRSYVRRTAGTGGPPATPASAPSRGRPRTWTGWTPSR